MQRKTHTTVFIITFHIETIDKNVSQLFLLLSKFQMLPKNKSANQPVPEHTKNVRFSTSYQIFLTFNEQTWPFGHIWLDIEQIRNFFYNTSFPIAAYTVNIFSIPT